MKIGQLYRSIKKEYLREKAAMVPEKYWSQFVCLGSASDWHYWWSRIVPQEKKKVLIVGVHGGRDYFYFKAAGYEVFGQDLFPDSDFGQMIIGNIEEVELPEKFFDVILISAVIEHLRNDFLAIKNLRKALKDDGLFINSFPLYNDWEETHLHIYSEEVMKRLMGAAGFIIEKKLMTPNLFFFPAIYNLPNHALNAFIYLLFKKTVYRYTLPPLWKLEFFLSQKNNFLIRFSRYFFGEITNGRQVSFIAKKSDVSDYLNLNKERFDTTKK